MMLNYRCQTQDPVLKFWGSQKLYANFLLHVCGAGLVFHPLIVQGSILYVYLYKDQKHSKVIYDVRRKDRDYFGVMKGAMTGGMHDEVCVMLITEFLIWVVVCLHGCFPAVKTHQALQIGFAVFSGCLLDFD